MVTPILTWYLTLQLMALLGLPLAFRLFRHLESRGYAVAKALGLLLTGVLFWWGGILQLWHNTAGAMATAGGLVLLAGLLLMRGHWHELGPWWREHRGYAITTEVLFLAAFVGWAVVRASQPQLQTAGGEKWMEIAFLNAILRSPTLPPPDPWMSGFSLSYYYLGYLLLAIVTRLSTIAPTVAFNLGNAGWYALVAIQAYSVLYDLTRGRATFRALLGPLMLLVTGNGEGLFELLHARGLFGARFWRWLDIRSLNEAPQPPFAATPQRFFWWWQASRTIRDRTPWGDHQEVIDEFPAFSFLLGDMHPHLLALPFVLVAIAVALNAYRKVVETGTDAPTATEGAEATSTSSQPPLLLWLTSAWYRVRENIWEIASCAVILGALGFLNTWDFPIYWSLIVGGWILGRYSHRERSVNAFLGTVWDAVPEAGVMGVLSVVLYLPFWFALRSQAGGILPNLFNATKPQQYVVMFLPLLVPVIGVIVSSTRHRKIKAVPAIGLGVGLLLAIVVIALIVGAPTALPYIRAIIGGETVAGFTLPLETAKTAVRLRLRNSGLAPVLAIAIGTVLYTMVRPRRADEAAPAACKETPDHGTKGIFPLLLVLMGLLLTLAPEFVFLKDIFTTRMNTVFKFYFQAWVMWSLAGAWQMATWLKPTGRTTKPALGRGIAAGLSLALIGVGLIYPILAIPTRSREQGTPWTLDGAAWLATSRPEDAAAIAWINENIPGSPVIVEAPGDQHKAYVYEGRVSALTGLPTVLGWGGHQLQWRGNYDEPANRETDLHRLMTTLDQAEAREILAKYGVGYVYVGRLERDRYAAQGLDKFDEMFPAVYDRDGVVLYQVGP